MNVTERIMALLADGRPRTHVEIAEGTGGSLDSVRSLVLRQIYGNLIVADQRKHRGTARRQYTLPQFAARLPKDVEEDPRPKHTPVDVRAIAWAASPFAMADAIANKLAPQPPRMRTYEAAIEDAIKVIRAHHTRLRQAGDIRGSVVLLSAIRDIKRVARDG